MKYASWGFELTYTYTLKLDTSKGRELNKIFHCIMLGSKVEKHLVDPKAYKHINKWFIIKHHIYMNSWETFLSGHHIMYCLIVCAFAIRFPHSKIDLYPSQLEQTTQCTTSSTIQVCVHTPTNKLRKRVSLKRLHLILLRRIYWEFPYYIDDIVLHKNCNFQINWIYWMCTYNIEWISITDFNNHCLRDSMIACIWLMCSML